MQEIHKSLMYDRVSVMPLGVQEASECILHCSCGSSVDMGLYRIGANKKFVSNNPKDASKAPQTEPAKIMPTRLYPINFSFILNFLNLSV